MYFNAADYGLDAKSSKPSWPNLLRPGRGWERMSHVGRRGGGGGGRGQVGGVTLEGVKQTWILPKWMNTSDFSVFLFIVFIAERLMSLFTFLSVSSFVSFIAQNGEKKERKNDGPWSPISPKYGNIPISFHAQCVSRSYFIFIFFNRLLPKL